MTTTTLHLGQVPGRARRVVACAPRAERGRSAYATAAVSARGGWRPVGTTGLGHLATTRETTVDATSGANPANAADMAFATIKRPAQHLGKSPT